MLSKVYRRFSSRSPDSRSAAARKEDNNGKLEQRLWRQELSATGTASPRFSFEPAEGGKFDYGPPVLGPISQSELEWGSLLSETISTEGQKVGTEFDASRSHGEHPVNDQELGKSLADAQTADHPALLGPIPQILVERNSVRSELPSAPWPPYLLDESVVKSQQSSLDNQADPGPTDANSSSHEAGPQERFVAWSQDKQEVVSAGDAPPGSGVPDSNTNDHTRSNLLQLGQQITDAKHSFKRNANVAAQQMKRSFLQPHAPEQGLYTSFGAENEIRLLEILPYKPSDGTLSCRLRSDILSPDTKYEALSYTWGEPEPRRRIRCNGVEVDVNPNLCAALERLARSETTRTVWIDAVCINQHNLEERSHQVKQMADLYANAQKVIVWLGVDKDKLAYTAFKIIRETVDFYNSRFTVQGLNEDLRSLPPPPRADESYGSLAWQSVNALFAFSWFGRVWTQQEIGLAASATLCWGDESIQWSYVVEFVMQNYFIPAFNDAYANVDIDTVYRQHVDLWSWYRGTDEKTWKYELPFTRQMSISRQKVLTQLESTSPEACAPILDLLNAERELEASDARDHIFAFLGHPATQFLPGGSPFVSPDYESATQSIYTRAATAILNQMQSLMLLSTVEHTTETLTDQDIPSWVPRWNLKSQSSVLGVITPQRERYYDASKTKQTEANGSTGRPAVFFEVLEKTLTVAGIEFDSIKFARPMIDIEDWKAKSKRKNKQGEIINNLNPLEYLLQQHVLLEHGGRKSTYKDPTEALGYTLRVGLGEYIDDPPLEEDQDRFRAQLRGHILEKCEFTESELGKLSIEDGPGPGPHASKETFLTGDKMWGLWGRRFFITSNGYFGLGSRIIEQGDLCCVLYGARVPMILRPTATEGEYRLIGECYVHGIMRGEAVDMNDTEKLSSLIHSKVFRIV